MFHKNKLKCYDFDKGLVVGGVLNIFPSHPDQNKNTEGCWMMEQLIKPPPLLMFLSGCLNKHYFSFCDFLFLHR